MYETSYVFEIAYIRAEEGQGNRQHDSDFG